MDELTMLFIDLFECLSEQQQLQVLKILRSASEREDYLVDPQED